MPLTTAQPMRQNWIVVAFGFLALSLAFSGRAALGLIMPVWQSEFGWTSSYISGVGASALVVMAIVAPFAGRLVDRRGSRFTLNLGMGLLGIGCAIVALMNSKMMFVIGFAGFLRRGFWHCRHPCRGNGSCPQLFGEPGPCHRSRDFGCHRRSVPDRPPDRDLAGIRQLALEFWRIGPDQPRADPLHQDEPSFTQTTIQPR